MIGFDGEQVLTGMSPPGDGKLTLYGPDGEAVTPSISAVGSSFERAKGPKVLVRVPLDANDLKDNPNLALTRFASLLAIDTNTDTTSFDGDRVSVTAVVSCEVVVESGQIVPMVAAYNVFEFHNAAANDSPERIGWFEMIKTFNSSALLPKPVGVVVDSALSEHQAINSRQEALYGSFFLPEGYDLVYGCGDRGTSEFFANTLVRECDAFSTRHLDKLRKEGLTGEYSANPSSPYGRFRNCPPTFPLSQGDRS